ILTSSLFSFFFYYYLAPPDLHSFPTRRSSDLQFSGDPVNQARVGNRRDNTACFLEVLDKMEQNQRKNDSRRHKFSARTNRADTRSEEHTSELQSRSDLVCRLLLEKKKRKKKKY